MRSIFVRSVRYGGAAALVWALACSIPAAAAISGRPDLRQGSSGFWVGVAQRDLTRIGYSLQDTGYFGPVMTATVNRFKAKHGLLQNGEIRQPTWEALVAQVRHEQSTPFHPAHLNSRGLAVAPPDAPGVVKRVIAAANKIAFKPYLWGGGHAGWNSPGYDCSGSVSYALHGGGLLWQPMTLFYSYGNGGNGKWITIYTNSSHAYMSVAGLWFDTADQVWGSYGHGDRWSKARVSGPVGYVVRHPFGF